MNTTLAVIPARGGSKGLPRKNILPLGGKPIITWTIEAALACPVIDAVLVTTDDEEIAAIARLAGVEVPFLRPSDLAGDNATMLDTVLHAVNKFEQANTTQVSTIVLLQPTGPLRTVQDINGPVLLLHESGADSVITVHRVQSAHPYYMYELNGDRALPLMPPPEGATQRQNYKPVYLRNGLVYATQRNVLCEQRSFYGHDVRAYETNPLRSINIDSDVDYRIAQSLVEKCLVPNS